MGQNVINARERKTGSKGELKSLRKNGGIPAVVYNRHGKVQHIALDAKEFAKAIEGVSESTIIQLLVGKESRDCLIKDRQLDWMRGNVLHVDFFEIEKGVPIKAKVSISLIGTPIGVRKGGILENPVHDIEVEALPKDMPVRFEIDIKDLDANKSIHVRDIVLPEGVRLISSPEQAVAMVKFARGEESTEEAAEAEVKTEEAAADKA